MNEKQIIINRWTFLSFAIFVLCYCINLSLHLPSLVRERSRLIQCNNNYNMHKQEVEDTPRIMQRGGGWDGRGRRNSIDPTLECNSHRRRTTVSAAWNSELEWLASRPKRILHVCPEICRPPSRTDPCWTLKQRDWTDFDQAAERFF